MESLIEKKEKDVEEITKSLLEAFKKRELKNGTSSLTLDEILKEIDDYRSGK